jgi:hypothetical protein
MTTCAGIEILLYENNVGITYIYIENTCPEQLHVQTQKYYFIINIIQAKYLKIFDEK